MKNLSSLGKFCVALVLLTTFTSVVYGQYEVWVRRYDGAGMDPEDGARAIVIDPSSGNVYITGFSLGYETTEQDYATVAYDSAGNELWAKRYNNGAYDGPRAIAVDPSSGYVYVTGVSAVIGAGDDYATIAYDCAGNELWVRRYDGPAFWHDEALAIGADSVSGNVYVTGYSWSKTGDVECATVAYDYSGNELWINRYDAMGNHAQANSLAVDSESGNVYIAGCSIQGGEKDFVTLAYDSAGNELWIRSYDGPAHLNDEATVVAVDSSSGYIYVSGFSYGIGTDRDYATVVYDSSGNELWANRYNGTGNGHDEVVDMVVDPSLGNIYVTGFSFGDTTYNEYATVAYDSEGNELWVNRYGDGYAGYHYASAITVDKSLGNVYLTCFSRDSIPTIAYDSAGTELWIITYKFLWERGHDIAVDSSSGSVYVTGESFVPDGHNDDFITIKYSLYTPQESIQNLITLVEILNLQQGIDNSLDVKLDAAYKALQDVNDNNTGAAVGALQAFINAVEAQRDIKISEPDANTLIAAAEEIIIMLNNM